MDRANKPAASFGLNQINATQINCVCLCCLSVFSQGGSSVECTHLSCAGELFFPSCSHTQVPVSMQIKCSWWNAGKTKREGEKKNIHSEKWHFFPPKICIFSHKCYLVEQQSWFYSVIQNILLFFLKVWKSFPLNLEDKNTIRKRFEAACCPAELCITQLMQLPHF